MYIFKKNITTSISVVAFLLYSLSFNAQAAPTFTAGSTPEQMRALLDGPGLAVSNLQITKGVPQQYGIVTDAQPLFGNSFDTGIFLNTGGLASLQGPNNSSAYYQRTGTIYADPDLIQISKYAKYDTAIIEFDIVPDGDRANFIFSFGSEEYPEFVCSQFNDAFGLFISGPGLNGTQNAAFLPRSTTPIAVNNVNGGARGSQADSSNCILTNTFYFVDNGNGSGNPNTQLDGFTKTLTSSIGGLQPKQTYHVKLALADAADAGYDSAAVFKWLTSTTSTAVDLSLTASGPKNPAFNTEIELTWTLTNNSSTAAGEVQVGIEWPVGLAWVSDDSAGGFNPTTNIWTVKGVPANGTQVLKIKVKLGTATNYTIPSEIIYAFNEDPDSIPLDKTTVPAEDDTVILSINPTTNSPPTIAATKSISLPENKVVVGTIKATDANNDPLTYSITGGTDADKFKIDPSTGALQFITPPDFEKPIDSDKNNLYIVNVTTSDGQSTATQVVTVKITDVVENNPPTLPATGSFSIPENQTDITTIKGSDIDNDVLTYSITGGADNALFTIDPKTGVLTFTSAPDFETPKDADTNNSYLVEVTVSDGASVAIETVTVNVTDVKENMPPKITQGNNAATLNVDFTENSRDIVLDYNAVDPEGDTEGNGLTWSIIDGADKAQFVLNPIVGILAFNQSPDYEKPTDADKNNSYLLKIQVCDSASKCTIQDLTVKVINVNEDTDKDGLDDATEVSLRTDPFNPDSDNDGLNDFDEVKTYKTNPLDPDSDKDKLTDSQEVLTTKTDPLNPDTDGDTVDDCTEVGANVSAPLDTDNNGKIDALSPDDDGDGILTKLENYNGGTPVDDDTDRDDTPDYLDTDDDNDGILTTFENPDPNKDGDPKDAQNTDGDTKPDYLDTDDDGDKKLTLNEQADPNGDGNPADAVDTDDDGTPNYLDKEDTPSASLAVKVFLQGPYDSSKELMNDTLHTLKLIPLAQPYAQTETFAQSFNYLGKEAIAVDSQGNSLLTTLKDKDAIVDWVLVDLRDATNPKTILGTKAALVQRDGDIVSIKGSTNLIFQAVPPVGNYYISVRHRNHLGIMTSTPIALKDTSSIIDFTQASTTTFGKNQRKIVGTRALMWGGDVDNNNLISANETDDKSDSNLLQQDILDGWDRSNMSSKSNYKHCGYYISDITLDGCAIASGPNNDQNLLVSNVMLHPDNDLFTTDYVIQGAIPR